MKLDIQLGQDKEFYEHLVKDIKLEPLELEIRKLNDQMAL
jgi:hypothetical protein